MSPGEEIPFGRKLDKCKSEQNGFFRSSFAGTRYPVAGPGTGTRDSGPLVIDGEAEFRLTLVFLR